MVIVSASTTNVGCLWAGRSLFARRWLFGAGCVKEGLLAVTCRLTSGGGKVGLGMVGGGIWGGGGGQWEATGGRGGGGVNGGREETIAHPITCNMPFSRFFSCLLSFVPVLVQYGWREVQIHRLVNWLTAALQCGYWHRCTYGCLLTANKLLFYINFCWCNLLIHLDSMLIVSKWVNEWVSKWVSEWVSK